MCLACVGEGGVGGRSLGRKSGGGCVGQRVCMQEEKGVV